MIGATVSLRAALLTLLRNGGGAQQLNERAQDSDVRLDGALRLPNLKSQFVTSSLRALAVLLKHKVRGKRAAPRVLRRHQRFGGRVLGEHLLDAS